MPTEAFLVLAPKDGFAILASTDAYFRVAGIAPELSRDHINRPLFDVLDGCDWPASAIAELRSSLERAVRDAVPDSCTLAAGRTAKGTAAGWRATNIAALDAQRQPVSIIHRLEPLAPQEPTPDRERLSTVLNAIDDAVFAVDDQWRFIYVNARAANVLGRSAQELVGQEIWKVFPETRATQFGRHYERAMREQQGVEFEEFSKLLGRWYSVRAHPSPRVLTVCFHDITELHQRHSRYRALFEHSQVAVLLTTPDGKIAVANAAALAMFGYDEQELRAVGRDSVVDTSDPGLANAIEERRRTGLFRGELRLKRKDGSVFPADLSSAIFVDETGHEWTSMFILDVSDRLAKDAAIRASERLLNGIFELLPVGVWIADRTGKIVRTNPAGLRIWGGARYVAPPQFGEYVGYWADSGKRIEADDWSLARAIKKGETTTGEVIRIHCFDGTWKTIINSALPLYDDEQSFAGAIVVNEDITELKEAEEALRQAVTARDDVLGIVAHDLRNPLAGLYLQLGLLAQRSKQGLPADPAGVDVMQRQTRRLDRIIQDLLDVTRIEAGAIRIECTPLAVQGLMERIERAHRELADRAGVALQVELAQVTPDIHADHDRLLQVFENLLGNALKFTDRGGAITMGAAPREGEVLFWVKDTGAGIDSDALPHVFDRFWQAGRLDRRGSGLGLAIAKGIVEAQGGRIWVETELGVGTTFFFTVPTRPDAGKKLNASSV